MKRISVGLMWIILPMILIFSLLGYQTAGANQTDKGMPQYVHPEALASTHWLQTHLEDKNIRIVDCIVPFWKPDSYYKGHIPGAVSLDVIGQLSDPKGKVPGLILPSSQFEILMGKIGINNDKMVVVYDTFRGKFAAKLWWALMYYGHQNVKILNGGLKRWKAEGRKLETESFVPSPTNFKATVQPSFIADIEDVKHAIERDDIYIVDALNEHHHFGRRPAHPTLAPAGHIPTAIHIWALSNINLETGLFLSPDKLKENWSQLKARPQDKVITYCGAGHYGAFDLFALYQLGYKQISLYDGSWYEWISDKKRPIATE